MALGQALFNHIVDFLVPHVENVQERRALVQSALRHLKLINFIEWEGSAHNFAVHLVMTLDRWGDNTLELLLNQLSPTVGDDQQKIIQTLIAQIRSATQTGHWEGSPFPGLQAFQERHEPIFFGREQEIYRLAERVRQNPLVAVIGASGSGKSSLMQAGVIPRLKQSREEKWQIIRFTPDQAGVKHPFASLRSALEQHWQTDLPSPDELAEDPALLKDICQTWLSGKQRLLLLVDQFEETFTTIQPTLRTPFIQALCVLLDLADIHIVLTLRSDFSEQAVNEPDLVDHLTPFLLSRPQPWALHQMIDGPAKAAAMTMEGELIDTLLSDTGSEPGNLALLAYTLDELYKIADARHERTIRMEDYTALGGVQGAIGKRAEQTFAKLTLPDKEKILAHVFRDLVEVDDRGTATRKRAPLATIAAAEQKLITAFTKARLLVSDEGWVEVAHEALFRSWERLKAWIAEAQEDLILLRQLQNAAYHWDRTGRPRYLLWPDERQRQVSAMRDRLEPNLSEIEEDFLYPEYERLLYEFMTAPEYRQLSIIDRWGEIGGQAISILEVYADDPNQAIRLRTLMALIKQGRATLSTLIKALQDEDISIRQIAALDLGKLGDTSVVPALIDALKDTDQSVRTAATESLEKLRSASAIPALINALKDTNLYVRWIAAINLSILGDVRAVPALIDALKDTDVSVRTTAAERLELFGDVRAVPALIDALKDTDVSVRTTVVQSLGTFGDVRAVPALIDALKDTDLYVRCFAALNLGAFGDVRAVPALIDALKDTDNFLRTIAAQSLGMLGDARAVPALIDALKDTNNDVRRTAARSLGTLSDPRAVPALIDLLKNNDISVRSIAAESLGKLGDTRATPALINLLEDKEDAIVQRTVIALVQIGDQVGLQDLRSNLKVVPLLLKGLKKSPTQDSQIIETLQAIGTPEALAAVEKWRQEHPDADEDNIDDL